MKSLKYLISFYRGLTTLISSGIDILRSLDTIVKTMPDRKIKQAVLKIYDNVKKGGTLAESFSLCPNVFSETEVQLIKFGEQVGRLDIILKRITDWLEFRQRYRRNIISNLHYPIILLHAAVLIPPLPMAIMEKSFMLYCKSTLPVLLMLYLVFFSSFFIVPRLIRISYIRKALDYVLLYMPVLGGIIKKVCISRFCFMLHFVLETGTPLIPGLKIAAHANGNEIIKNVILKEIPFIEKGESIGRIFQQSNIFSRITLEFWQTGEESGKTVEMMAKIAEYYRNESEAAIKTLITWIPRIIYYAVMIYTAFMIITVF